MDIDYALQHFINEPLFILWQTKWLFIFI